MSNEITTYWRDNENAPTGTLIPADESKVANIVGYAYNSLTEKQAKQIATAFEMGAYDMAAEYAWKKAIAKLRNSLESLGMPFVGEFLQRSDVTEFTPIDEVLTERAAIDLAERLGVVTKTAAIKLRQAQELITHFMSGKADEEIGNIDALSIIKTSVQYILSEQDMGVAVEFSDFRKRLLSEALDLNDPAVYKVINGSLFLIRTVLTILLSTIKSESGVQKEYALTNFNILLPAIWETLSETDKYHIGEVYSYLTAKGDIKGATQLKIALSKINGFDYVPETLRSTTFKDAARKVIDVHFDFNNFYNEPSAVNALASLGTIIPQPAFQICVDAYLLVYLGNWYSYSHDAAPIAREELLKISKERWFYYFEHLIEKDEYVLDNLNHKHQVDRFSSLLEAIGMEDTDKLPKYSRYLYDAILNCKYGEVTNITNKLKGIK